MEFHTTPNCGDCQSAGGPCPRCKITQLGDAVDELKKMHDDDMQTFPDFVETALSERHVRRAVANAIKNDNNIKMAIDEVIDDHEGPSLEEYATKDHVETELSDLKDDLVQKLEDDYYTQDEIDKKIEELEEQIDANDELDKEVQASVGVLLAASGVHTDSIEKLTKSNQLLCWHATRLKREHDDLERAHGVLQRQYDQLELKVNGAIFAGCVIAAIFVIRFVMIVP